jgi:hypothetical protein
MENTNSEISKEKTEPKKTLETAVEKAMKATQEVANEYNETKLKKEDIDSAQSIEELISKIEASEGLQGSQEYFDKDTLKMIIEKVQSGELSIDYVTRSGGLRQKVFDLIGQQERVDTNIEDTEELEQSGEVEELDEAEDVEDEQEDVEQEQEQESEPEQESELVFKDLEYYSDLYFVKKIDEDIDETRKALLEEKVKEIEITNSKQTFFGKVFSAFSSSQRELEIIKNRAEALFKKHDRLLKDKAEYVSNKKMEDFKNSELNQSEVDKYRQLNFSDIEDELIRKKELLKKNYGEGSKVLVDYEREVESFKDKFKTDTFTFQDVYDSQLLKIEELDDFIQDFVKKRIYKEIYEQVFEKEKLAISVES